MQHTARKIEENPLDAHKYDNATDLGIASESAANSATNSTPPKRSRRLLQNNHNLAFWIQLGVSVLTASGTLLLFAQLKNGDISSSYKTLAILSSLLLILIYRSNGIYRQFADWKSGLQKLAKSWFSMVVLLILVAFATKTTHDYSRMVIVFWALGGFVAQSIVYLGMSTLQARVRMRYSEKIRTLIVGSGDLTHHLVEGIVRNRWLQDQIVGVVEDDELKRKKWSDERVPMLGGTEDIEHIIKAQKIRRVYIALPLHQSSLIESLQQLLLDNNVDVIWAPDIFHMNLLNHSVREIAGMPLILLSETPMVSSGSAFIKALEDKVISTLALLALAPLMLVIATIIRLSSPGPVIFKQHRHGWDGRVIEVWKFRSMYLHDNDGKAVKQASIGDPRITPIGRFIRRTSIDELPQLLNVLQGTMSLVGPRPHAISHNDYYCQHIDKYRSRHRIKPGITGLAQVKGLRGETQSIQKMKDRVDQDIAYICHWSLWLDIKILLLTPFNMLSKNAY